VGAAPRARGGEILVTADHGNAEKMHDDATGQPHTAHTLNLVPCLYVGRVATPHGPGALQDIAPTLLAMMGLSQPEEMTGHALFDIAR
jgi:2,3-bisphosphoglycerate-independent phosphoglycerate mutase